MSDEQIRNEDTDFERQDLSAGGIFGFLAGLAIAALLIHIILAGMFRYLDTYEKRHEPPQNPLLRSAQLDTRQPPPEEVDKFPLPRLETNERAELNDQLRGEEERLNSYGWVDQKAGIAHIPIDRAMALIAQRGLPIAPQNSAARQGKANQKTSKPAGKPRAQPQ